MMLLGEDDGGMDGMYAAYNSTTFGSPLDDAQVAQAQQAAQAAQAQAQAYAPPPPASAHHPGQAAQAAAAQYAAYQYQAAGQAPAQATTQIVVPATRRDQPAAASQYGTAVVPQPAVYAPLSAGGQQQQQQAAMAAVAAAARPGGAAAVAAAQPVYLAQREPEPPSFCERAWSRRRDIARLVVLALVVWLAVSAHATTWLYLNRYVEAAGQGLTSNKELALRVTYPLLVLLALWGLKMYASRA